MKYIYIQYNRLQLQWIKIILKLYLKISTNDRNVLKDICSDRVQNLFKTRTIRLVRNAPALWKLHAYNK